LGPPFSDEKSHQAQFWPGEDSSQETLGKESQ